MSLTRTRNHIATGLILIGITGIVLLMVLEIIGSGSPGFGPTQVGAGLIGAALALTGVLLRQRTGRAAYRRRGSVPDAASNLVSRKTRILASIIQVSILGVALLLAAEIGARFFATRWLGTRAFLYGFAPRDVVTHQVQRDGYWVYPPYDSTLLYRDEDGGETEIVRINNIGLRGPDVTIAKPAGVIRVVTLGASSTFGYGNRNDETYPYYLEQILNEQYGGEERFEVINLGLPHSVSPQISSLLEDLGMSLDPDIVTFYEGINDTKLAPNWLQRAGRSSMLAMLFEEVSSRRRERFTAQHYDDAIDEKVGRFLESLERMKAACDEAGIHFVVVGQQAKSVHYVRRDEIRGTTYEEEYEIVSERLFDAENKLSNRGLWFTIHRALMTAEREWAVGNDVAYVDGIGALDQRRDVLTSWVHLTPEGNRILAEAIADRVLSIPPIADQTPHRRRTS